MARPIRFYPPGVLMRCVRFAARPIPDAPELIRKLQMRLRARDDRIAYVRVDRDAVETVFWAENDASEVSSLLNVVHSKLSRDINALLGTPGFVNFPGTSEPLPLFDQGLIDSICVFATVGGELNLPCRGVLLGPDYTPIECDRFERPERRRAVERFVHMLRPFLDVTHRVSLARTLLEGIEYTWADVAGYWRADDLADRPPSSLLQRFTAASDAVRSVYLRTGRDLAREIRPGQAALGTHLHRPLVGAPTSVQEPVVSTQLGSTEPVAWCSTCEGRAGGPIDWSDPDVDPERRDRAFIASLLRPRRGIAGGGGRLLDGRVSVVATAHDAALGSFLRAWSTERRRRLETGSLDVRVGWDPAGRRAYVIAPCEVLLE